MPPIIERPEEQNKSKQVEDFVDSEEPKQYKKSYRQEKLERTPQHLQEVKDKELDEVPMAEVYSDVAEMDPDKRPTVEVVREDGKSQRRRRSVSLGLSELILPPFTKGKIAKYRAIYRDQIDPATNLRPELTDVLLPATYQFYDKFEADPLHRSKLMRNLGREEVFYNNVTEKEERKHTLVEVELTNGILDVNIEKDYRLYVFMELHPLNISNKHRDFNNAPVFERIGLKTEFTTAYKSAEADLARDAEDAVIHEITSADRIIGMAVGFGIPVHDRVPSDIKHDLRLKAREDPKKFFSMSNNIAPAIKLNIHDGLGKGIIQFNVDRNRFEFTETGKVMHTVPIGEDGVEDFTKTILRDKDARAMYDEMMDMLNYWV